MATHQKRQSSPGRGRKSKYADISSRKETNLQRELDEKAREVNELKASLSKAKSDAKDADIENAKWQEAMEMIQEKQAVLQTSVKRQAGVIDMFETNERASDRRFQILHSENARLRAFNKKLLAAQEKSVKEVQLQMNKLLALHPDETTDTDTTELDRDKNVRKRDAAEVASSSSDSESEAARPTPAAGAPAERNEEEPSLATQSGLSAETLPMSPAPELPRMPEPCSEPMALTPPPADAGREQTVFE